MDFVEKATKFIYRQPFPRKIGQVFSCFDLKIARARGIIYLCVFKFCD
jgi:hypothetical protein